MRSVRLLLAAAVVAGSAAAAPAAHAWPGIPRPGIALGAGVTFAVSGEPSGGGASFSFATTWPVAERWRMGVEGYADDLGTSYTELTDPNDGTPLGTTATLHRWTYGFAWRAETDAWRLGRWSGGASGAWGWWRIEDDHLGTTVAATSAVGFRFGADARRPLGSGRDVGVALNYHHLAEGASIDMQRVDRYASAALQLRWAGAAGND
jgi:hypothetical protein